MEEGEIRKSRTWVWALVIIIVLAGVGGGVYFLIKKDKPDNSTDSTSSSKSSVTATAEQWEAGGEIVLANTTSSDTHKISDNLFRMYYMGKGGILYTESSDGIKFGEGVQTGVTEDPGKMISNPSVQKIYDGKWIMIYEEQPQKAPG